MKKARKGSACIIATPRYDVDWLKTEDVTVKVLHCYGSRWDLMSTIQHVKMGIRFLRLRLVREKYC